MRSYFLFSFKANRKLPGEQGNPGPWSLHSAYPKEFDQTFLVLSHERIQGQICNTEDKGHKRESLLKLKVYS